MRWQSPATANVIDAPWRRLRAALSARRVWRTANLDPALFHGDLPARAVCCVHAALACAGGRSRRGRSKRCSPPSRRWLRGCRSGLGAASVSAAAIGPVCAVEAGGSAFRSNRTRFSRFAARTSPDACRRRPARRVADGPLVGARPAPAAKLRSSPVPRPQQSTVRPASQPRAGFHRFRRLHRRLRFVCRQRSAPRPSPEPKPAGTFGRS